MQVKIVKATADDVSDILKFIRELAVYEKLEHEVTATESQLRETLFGQIRSAEVLLLEEEGVRVGFALFFHNYSTFLGKPGIYLEDLYIQPTKRGRGYGKKMLAHMAQLAVERGCGRFEWSVLDWNTPAIEFYESLGSKQLSEWTMHRLTGDALRQLAGQAD
jgi:GNAT superfamily N-acetyltransferase